MNDDAIRVGHRFAKSRFTVPSLTNQKTKKALMHGSTHFKIGVLLGIFALVFGCGKKADQAQGPPPPEVKVITIEAQEVQVPIEFVGQILGAEDIAIRARVEGFLEGIHFEEGGEVEAGQLLYTIESQPY